jgi:hypothetical protein
MTPQAKREASGTSASNDRMPSPDPWYESDAEACARTAPQLHCRGGRAGCLATSRYGWRLLIRFGHQWLMQIGLAQQLLEWRDTSLPNSKIDWQRQESWPRHRRKGILVPTRGPFHPSSAEGAVLPPTRAIAVANGEVKGQSRYETTSSLARLTTRGGNTAVDIATPSDRDCTGTLHPKNFVDTSITPPQSTPLFHSGSSRSH